MNYFYNVTACFLPWKWSTSTATNAGKTLIHLIPWPDSSSNVRHATASSAFVRSAEPVLANADSGTTGTYLRLQDAFTIRSNHRCSCRGNANKINASWLPWCTWAWRHDCAYLSTASGIVVVNLPVSQYGTACILLFKFCYLLRLWQQRDISRQPRLANRVVDGRPKKFVHVNCKWEAVFCICGNQIRFSCGLCKFLARSVRFTSRINIFIGDRQLIYKSARINSRQSTTPSPKFSCHSLWPFTRHSPRNYIHKENF